MKILKITGGLAPTYYIGDDRLFHFFGNFATITNSKLETLFEIQGVDSNEE